MDKAYLKCFLCLAFLFFCVNKSWCTTCYYQTSRATYTRCYAIGRCRDGNRSAICATLTGTSACTLQEGYVKESASGPVHTWSGGTCVAPDVCADCNNGYYPDGPHCKACPEIANCYYTSCTDLDDRVCKYCKGVVKDDSTQYGWWAFTRWTDGGQSCKASCSWRAGSRCYPGSCLNTTLDSCVCADGFAGTDCATITDKPLILQSTAALKQITDMSVETVDGPIDTSSPSPQDTVWTNNLLLHSVSGSVDAQYAKVLPDLPRSDFYVNKDKSNVGTVSGGVSFELQRGMNMSEVFMISCRPSDPKPNNFSCDGNFEFHEKWSSFLPLQHLDIIIFKTFATNGGYITTYDRENNNTEVRYNMTTNNFTNTFFFGFDTEPPLQCKMLTCNTEPLTIPDVSIHGVFDITWDEWNDTVSGLKSYHFEVFHLRPTGFEIDSELKHGDKVTEDVPEETTEDVNTISVTVPFPGPYSLTITAIDKAGNHRTARRVMIFDDISVVELQGDNSHTSDTNIGCTWLTEPGAPVVINAEPLSNCEWINKPTSLVNIGWRHRFINVRHHAGQWLNQVSHLDNVLVALEDHEGIRQLDRKPNVLGIVRFELSYNVTYEGSTTIFPFVETANVENETTEVLENMMDGKGINITIRAFDIVDVYIDNHLIIKSDTSNAIIEYFWLIQGNNTHLEIHNKEELESLTIELKTYDYHSGINEIKWRLYTNYTGGDIVRGLAYESPKGQATIVAHYGQTFDNNQRGENCYCTPFDGCFYTHYQGYPDYVTGDVSNIISRQRIGDDLDCFIEVTVTNKAMLTSSVTKKITIRKIKTMTDAVESTTADVGNITKNRAQWLYLSTSTYMIYSTIMWIH